MSVISFRHVSKKFRLRDDRHRSFRSVVVDWFRNDSRAPELWAVRDVSFDIARSESIGIIGGNGSGKSTILKLIAMIVEPTLGQVTRSGTIAALLELGAGFHPEYTGRENIFLYGSFFGIGRAEMQSKYDEIVEFSELGEFIDQPVKHYSSGMYLRLAFASIIALDPDVFLIDEILAVGDEHFKNKCLERIGHWRTSGKTMVIVSHNLTHILELCDRAVWVDRGHQMMDGDPASVVKAYLSHIEGLDAPRFVYSETQTPVGGMQV